MSREATERRIRAGGFAGLEPDEEIVAWCRAWVSRAGHLQRLTARWRDVAVVTDRRLLLFGVGHFTRRPRRLMLADLLDKLAVADIGTHPGRGLRCSRPGRPPVLLELGGDAWSRRFGVELQARATGATSTAEQLITTATTPAPSAPAPRSEPTPSGESEPTPPSQ